VFHQKGKGLADGRDAVVKLPLLPDRSQCCVIHDSASGRIPAPDEANPGLKRLEPSTCIAQIHRKTSTKIPAESPRPRRDAPAARAQGLAAGQPRSTGIRT